ncbi:protein ANTAGONIST OF LIKE HETEROCHROMATIN PROTEIN 1-like [Megalops cyprinoides]|uniref:protein ANTAGONIST OF LIKE HETEROCHROMATIN PROTEIN 1-like n=1 Tax=Megalops cyprinoides TaxID=118141 RepID=UPI0018650068|nr:protein ANTAGONIST OF LIKE HETEROCHROMATIN PROTEIN 1-like [Megalops cyprinoides]
MYSCVHFLLNSYKRKKRIDHDVKSAEEAEGSQALVRNSSKKYVTLVRRGLQRRNRILLANAQKRRKVALWKHLRSSEWWDNVLCDFSDSQWQRNFRMSRETFEYLCAKVKPAIERKDTALRLCVPLQKRVGMALWKLATSSDYRTVGHLFGVGVTTVCRCLHEFCQAVNQIVLPEVLRTPTPEELADTAALFEERWGVAQCIGAIDSSHVPIIAPKEFHHDYFNSKDWHSIVLQAVVDGRGLFWDVSVGCPGSACEAGVLRQSKLWTLASSGALFPGRTRRICGEDVGYYIIGDSAYPLQNWLMKPFEDTGKLSARQKRFNAKIGQARSVAVNAFCRLKGRWKCLTKRNDCNVDVIKAMVLTCCVLHNLCEKRGETFTEDWDGQELQRPVNLPHRDGDEGSGVRNALAQYFSSEQ